MCNDPAGLDLDQAEFSRWYAVAFPRVHRTLSVTGPGPSTEMPLWNKTSTIDLNGSTADIGFDDTTGLGHAEWLIDGERWMADGAGVDRPQFLAAVRAVVFSNGAVDPSRVPSGFTTLSPTLGGPPPTITWQVNRVEYRFPESDDGVREQGSDQLFGPPDLQFTVSYGLSRRFGPGIGSRPVTINGHPGGSAQRMAVRA